MAVQKRKTSPSKRGMRRAHALPKIIIVTNPKTGLHHLPHIVSKDGT